MLPTWSDRAKKAVSLFFRKWNDIDIYVEDRSFCTLKIYNEILNRISGGKYRVERVFPLGPKHNVIEACKNHDQACGREALYIVDGDLDLLISNGPIENERLYIQGRYCLENFLVDDGAMAEILYEEDSGVSRDDALARVEYEKYLIDMESLLELFVIFAVMRKFLPGVQSVGMGLSKFITGGKVPVLDKQKISKYIGDMHSVLCEIYGANVILEEELTIIDKTLGENSALVFVSGKDYLFPAFLFHIRKRQKIHSTNDSIKVRLARHCDLRPLENLRKAMDNRSKML